jgi:hypothetical protein
MFLSKLNDNEKKAFMSLARKLVLTDNQIDEFEQNVIDGFMTEMVLSKSHTDFPAWDNALLTLANSANSIKRAVIVELLSVCYANNDFDVEQVKLLDEIRVALGIPTNFTAKAKAWVQKILDVTSQGFNLVEGI